MSAQPEQGDRRSGGAVRNPEASTLVAIYRRVVPLAARRAVAGHASLRLRSAVKRSLTLSQALPDHIAERRAGHALRRSPETFAAPGRRLVTVDRRPKAAHVRPHPSPVQAQAQAVHWVCEALEEAGIEHFAVRGNDPAAGVVGVPAARRDDAVTVLAALAGRTAGYLTTDGTGRTGPRTTPAVEKLLRRRAQQSAVLPLCWYFTDDAGESAVGDRFGCDVEFWAADERGGLVAPRPNRCTDEVPPGEETVTVPLDRVNPLLPAAALPGPAVRTLPEFSHPLPDDIRFPVDAVYTWVDGSDPAWLRRRAEHAGEGYHEEAANAARFLSRDELRYSLRSLAQYAPWINHVYLVTDDQTPDWLDTTHPGITVVSHREIFADPSVLPTFNSHAIESQLHHIEGLSEHFLYLNDDVFLGRPATPQDFFLANGLSKFFLSKAHVPFGRPSAEDVPVSVAGKNNRTVIEERFGSVITQKMKHVPHALQRSVLQEIEEEFAERHRATAANRFRELNDLSVTSSLHHYYAFLTGRAVPGEMVYNYFDMAHPHTPARLGRLLAARDRSVFCLNDTVSSEADLADQLAVMKPFLRSYFPFASPFERSGDRAASGGSRGSGSVPLTATTAPQAPPVPPVPAG
ncbi:stealth family protein [Streptomyces bohaiensis]|uniref:stealth family protein n=1 Tax=Streptomyces bohaiensis TaxID=1431344 RepID=UPI003B81414B